MKHSITCRLAQYLDNLLQPIIRIYLRSTLFLNGASFLQQLHAFTEDKTHPIRSTTIFASLIVTNFYHMVSHETMLHTLKDFLISHTIEPCIEDVPIYKILRLTELFLYNNRFYYKNKIYKFSKGGPTSLLYVRTLSNIYLYQWHKLFLKQSSMKNEFFGR